MPDVLRVQSASIETPVKCVLPHGLSSGGYVPQSSFTDWIRGDQNIAGPGNFQVLAAPANSQYSIYRAFLTLDPTGVAFPVHVDWSWGLGAIFAQVWFTANKVDSVFDFAPFGVRSQPPGSVGLFLLNQGAAAIHFYWTVLYCLEI